MKLAIVLGTRPEIIKIAPIVRACQKKKIDFFIVHSGQHYSPNMDAVFFEQLELPEPKYRLDVGKLEYRKRVGTAMRELIKIFEHEWPDAVFVEGDTFTVLIGALAAKKLDRPVAHLEAGLRSHDLTMPEENNRIITDHIAEFLYPPTDDALKNLHDEGLDTGARTVAPVFGNTVVDALLQNVVISERAGDVLKKLGLTKGKYILATSHRQENVDNEMRLRGIIDGLARVAKEHPDLTIFFPIHPRTEKMMTQFGIARPRSIHFGEPQGYMEFLQLQKHAALIITDSGGVQEEATVFHVPCVTIRDNTERPETVEYGMNMLAGADAERIAKAATVMLKKQITWKPVYGTGTAAEDVIEHLARAVARRKSFSARARWVARSVGRVVGFRKRESTRMKGK